MQTSIYQWLIDMINLSSINGYSILSYKQLPVKVNNRKTITWYEICLTIKTPCSSEPVVSN